MTYRPLGVLLMLSTLLNLIGCAPRPEGVAQSETVLNHTVRDISGNEVDLQKYKGQVLLIVNVASRCGYTPQYDGLQALHEQYADQGLAILGFPCNQFLGQEPGSGADIQEFCRVNYGVTFDLFEKIEVNGDNASPLYQQLKSIKTEPITAGDIYWNFEKFLVDRNGLVVGRYGSGTTPDDLALVAAIKRELKQ